MIETLKIQLRLLKMSGIKPNFSELGREYGLDRRTVKKYYDGYEGKPGHHNKSSRLDQYRSTIETKMSLKGATVMGVYEFMLDKDPNIGTYSNFVKYTRSRGIRPQKTQKGHPRYETEPGMQAQVDWKEDISIANCNGEVFRIQIFNYELGYSRYPVFTYRLFKTRQDVFDCLIASFRATGGVPREILFDNMSSVVDRDGNRASVGSRMKAFADDMGFSIKLCKPRHPYTKGKIEASNKFLNWLIPYEGEFETADELKEIIENVNTKVWNRVNQETGVPPLLLFQKEKEYLQPLPKNSIIESYLSHDRQTTVRKDSMVTYNKSRYSVPPEYIGHPVTLRTEDDLLIIYHREDVIATHKISEKRINYRKEDYIKLLSPHFSDRDTLEQYAESNLRQMDELL